MFCPKCKAEYRSGFTECPDCGVSLVHEPPHSPPSDPEENEAGDLVEVFSTYNQADLVLIKALLDAEGIVYHFQGELFVGSGVFITPAALFVAKRDAETVKVLLKGHGIQ